MNVSMRSERVLNASRTTHDKRLNTSRNSPKGTLTSSLSCCDRLLNVSRTSCEDRLMSIQRRVSARCALGREKMACETIEGDSKLARETSSSEMSIGTYGTGLWGSKSRSLQERGSRGKSTNAICRIHGFFY